MNNICYFFPIYFKCEKTKYFNMISFIKGILGALESRIENTTLPNSQSECTIFMSQKIFS